MQILEKAQQRFFPTAFDKMVRKFYADGGEVTLRYDYPLDPSSTVLDLGGYRGDWSARISERYDPTIYVFEPVAAFAEAVRTRFANNPKVLVIQAGLGGRSRTDRISIRDNDSSAFRPAPYSEPMQVIEMEPWLRERGIEEIALAKLNIEGAEYELLDHMIEHGLQRRCRDVQVQFHDLFPDAAARMERIGAELAKTHRLTYDYRFVWQNWQRI